MYRVDINLATGDTAVAEYNKQYITRRKYKNLPVPRIKYGKANERIILATRTAFEAKHFCTDDEMLFWVLEKPDVRVSTLSDDEIVRWYTGR